MFDTWLFDYGEGMGHHSLREFEAQPALLPGYRRSFSHRSTLRWGDTEAPCPILGLSRGGECWGVAFRVPWLKRRAMLKWLQPQEATDEFERIKATVKLRRSGEEVSAAVWVSRGDRAREAAEPDLEALHRALLEAHGIAGKGVEYVREIVHAMGLYDIEDPLIERLWERMESWRPR